MEGRATRIDLLDFSTVPMRAFHMTWMAFFVCFFAWFALAPLMPLIREDLGLTNSQLANINIAAVCVTIFVRVLIGPLCDRYGPRLTYTWLLAFGAIPVVAIAFSHSYAGFLFWRLCLGAVGASFVVTQIHTSLMFAPNVVGAANAAAAGWGNAGGGAAQAIMPLVAAALLTLGLEGPLGWRVAMGLPGLLMAVMAIAYYRCTRDAPQGSSSERSSTPSTGGSSAASKSWSSFRAAARDYRVWMLFITYAACFGVELTIHNIGALYFVDHFSLDLARAGIYVGCFGLLALFARALGGIASDRLARRRGLDGRVTLLFMLVFAEGVGLIVFSRMPSAGIAFIALMVFGLFTHMACGATYSLVPFINRSALGGVAGIIGAGGNVGAVAAGILVKGASTVQHALFLLGAIVTAAAVFALAVRFSQEQKLEERRLYAAAMSGAAREVS